MQRKIYFEMISELIISKKVQLLIQRRNNTYVHQKTKKAVPVERNSFLIIYQSDV